MPKELNLTGQRFGRLVAVELAHRDDKYVSYWKCQCDCGKTKIIVLNSLRSGRTKSCGCLHIESARERITKHGKSKTAEYGIWANIKSRCAGDHHRYGGRGISMAPEWVDNFPAFLAYVGPRPSEKHSIDRINYDGNYEPGNVRWATDEEQANNKSSNHLLTKDGITKNLTQWSNELGLSQQAIRNRINEGWPEEKVLVPVNTTRIAPRWEKHGESFSPEYEAWHAMMMNHRSEICQEWVDSAEAFLNYVPDRPSANHVFVRIDKKAPYGPGNVQWITRKEKQRSLPQNVWIEMDGERRTVAEWAERAGMDQKRLRQRLRQGWELRDALVEPFRVRVRKANKALAASG